MHNNITISLFDFNKKTVKRIEVSNLLDFELPAQTKGAVRLFGLEIEEVGMFVSDRYKFLNFVFEYIFEGYEIINTEGKYGGHPDFILKKDEEKIYVEVKWEDDSLRMSQLEWMWNNPNKEIRILHIYNDKLKLKLNEEKKSLDFL